VTFDKQMAHVRLGAVAPAIFIHLLDLDVLLIVLTFVVISGLVVSLTTLISLSVEFESTISSLLYLAVLITRFTCFFNKIQWKWNKPASYPGRVS